MGNNCKLFRWGVIAFFLLTYLLPLGWRPMITPDEFRYGEIPREMIASGDYISPRLIGIRYFEKPVYGYQLTALSMLVFGENAFAVRLPSALCAGLAAWLLYFLVLKFRKDEALALLSSLLYLTCGLVYGIGVFAVLDSQMTAFITGILAFYFLALHAEAPRERRKYLVLSGCCCGLAFLTKGFIAFAVPAVTVIPYLLWERRFKAMFTTPWLLLLFAVLVAGPWCLAIHWEEPSFWHYFFWVEHYQRFFEETSGQHPEPFWFFLPVILGGIFPAALLLGGMVLGFKQRVKTLWRDPLLKYALLWFIMPLLFFSCSSGKLATYVLPCFAPLAIIGATGLLAYLRAGGRKTLDITLNILAIILPVAAVGFTVAQLLVHLDLCPGLYSKAEFYKWIPPVVTVLYWGGILWFFRRKALSFRLGTFFFGLALVIIAGQAAFPHQVGVGKAQAEQLEKFRQDIPDDAVLLVHPNVMHAAAWIYRRTDFYFPHTGGELEHSLSAYPEYADRLITGDRYAEFIRQNQDRLILLMRSRSPNYLPAGWKQPPFERCEDRLWLVKFQD